MVLYRFLVLAILPAALWACVPQTLPPTATFSPALYTQAPARPEDGEPQPGGTLVVSFGLGEPRHFNPALVSGSATAIPGAQLFASPLRFDENWNPQPYLAESWQVAEDGLSLTLHLVAGATFHDGQPITSEDVAFSVFTVQKYHPFKTMFAPVTAVETPDPLTAIIRLSQPHPAILLAMSPPFLPVLPKHIYGDGQEITTHPANLAPVGSGPFKFVSYEPGKRLVLERYGNFFIPGRPYLDRLEFWIDSDPASQTVSLLRQDAHLATMFIDFPGLERMSQTDTLVVTRQGFEAIGPLNWLAFNLLREPLSDVRVRQALAYAIDLDFITTYLHQGYSQRALGPIAPSSPFYEPDLPANFYDPEKAARLLDEAGYPLQPDGTRFTLTLDYLPITASQQHDVAQYIQHQLLQIGIQVKLRDSVTFPAWAERIGSWDFDMTTDSVFNWGDPVIGVHRTYTSDNIRQGVVWSNTQNYSNPEVDQILARAAVEMDAEARKALYSRFQKIVSADLPVLPINVIPYHTIYHAGLGNPPLTIWGVNTPFDAVYWRQPPQREYLPAPQVQDEDDLNPLVLLGIEAIRRLEEDDFYTVRQQLNDPSQGFLELAGSGIHLVGFNRDGTVFLDNSGQFQPGMDLGALLDAAGNPILPLLVAAAEAGSLETFPMEEVWPHPAVGKVGPVSIWCGHLTRDEVVCILAWHPQAGDAP